MSLLKLCKNPALDTFLFSVQLDYMAMLLIKAHCYSQVIYFEIK